MVLLRATWWSLVAAFAVLASQPPKSIEEIRKAAFRLAQERKFAEASAAYRELREKALEAKDPELAVQALNAMAGCAFGLYQYREAIQTYEKAHSEAVQIGSKELEGMIAANTASLYAALGDENKALQMLRRYPLNGSSIRIESRLDWLILLLQVSARAEDKGTFFQVLPIAEAESRKPVPEKLIAANPERHKRWPEAQGELRRAWLYDVLSDAYDDFNDFDAALAYAREAYRIRATFRDPSRLRGLVQQCILERKTGNFRGAWRISEIVIGGKDLSPTPMQSFRVHRERALILMAEGKSAEALVEYRKAMFYPRAWRSEVLPADSTILNFENFMNGEIHQEFLNAIASLPEASFTRELAEESFWVAEEARFASLRAAFLPRDEIAKRLGAEYWPLLRKFQDLQTKVLAGDSRSTGERDRMEAELHQRELQAGLSIPHRSATKVPERAHFASWQRSIPDDETVFVFHLSEPHSLAWAISSKGIEMKRLERKQEIESAAQAFLATLGSTPKANGGGTSSSLTTKLFGEFSYPYRTNPFWTVVVEDTLARIPMSALPTLDDPSRFLVEAHTIRLLSSATMLNRSTAEAWGQKAFAFADPVYNGADERGKGRAAPAGTQTGTWELNRLPGTMMEAKLSFAPLSASRWETQITAGREASVGELRSQAAASPDILHIATHFSLDPERPDLMSIALSGSSGTQPALFSAKDLTALRTKTKLVVLDGCASASGVAYSGLGIVGLSRAWLISGASNVVSTLWPIPDVAGPFFPSLYSRISSAPYSSRAISKSLRETQIEFIRRKDRYSAPRYWAAYVLLQRS